MTKKESVRIVRPIGIHSKQRNHYIYLLIMTYEKVIKWYEGLIIEQRNDPSSGVGPISLKFWHQSDLAYLHREQARRFEINI